MAPLATCRTPASQVAIHSSTSVRRCVGRHGDGHDQRPCWEYPPTADDADFTISHDRILTVAAPGLVSHGADADGDHLTASKSRIPAWNTGCSTNGSFTYTPVAAYVGMTTFTYNLNDGVTDSNSATITLHVTINSHRVTMTTTALFTTTTSQLRLLQAC